MAYCIIAVPAKETKQNPSRFPENSKKQKKTSWRESGNMGNRNMSNKIYKCESETRMTASAALQKEIEAELKKEDPSTLEQAKAAIAKSKKEVLGDENTDRND